MVLFVGVNDASAHPGHTSCKDLGLIQAGVGAETGPLTAAAATSGPNVISDLTATAHNSDYCEH